MVSLKMPTGRIDSQQIKAIVFDFDGVIVESNHIKHTAFNDLFKDYSEHSEIMQYHLAHNAVDRYRKFRHIAKDILKISGDTEKLETEWADNFRDMTRERIIDCSYVAGARELLEYLKGRAPMFLASATPKSELDVILESKELTGYFDEVFGSPIVKSEVLKMLLGRLECGPEELLFVGDSPEDRKAALDAGVPFVGRVSDYSFEGVPAFEDMMGIFKVFKTGGSFELSGSAIQS